VGDYVSAYGFMLKYSQLLGPSKPVELVLAGYSYGSMIASYQPSVEDVKAIFFKPKTNSPAAKVIAKAKQVAAGELVNEDEEFYDIKRVVKIEDTESDLPPANISFLLVSPILSFALGFVTLWANLSKLWIGNKRVVTPVPDQKLPGYKTLVVYGTDDMFTSAKGLQTWTRKLKDAPESQVDAVEVHMAGHFWMEDSFHQKLKQAIGNWLGKK
jgi:alpha/beta superfamily hydrolase